MPRLRPLCLLLVCQALVVCGCAPWGRNKPPGADDEKPVKAEEDMPWIDRLSPDYMRKSYKKAIGHGPDMQKGRDAYARGAEHFNKQEYKKAATEFQEAADRAPDSALEEDALFMEADSYFFDNRYSTALDKYSELVKKYSNCRHMDLVVSRQFQIGAYWEQMDEKNHYMLMSPNFTDRTRPWFDTQGNAMYAFEQTRLNDPRGPYADAAVMATGNSMFLRHKWEDADYYYGLIRTEYPKSKYQVDAHLLGLQCKLRKYQGSAYDGKPLDEADRLIDQMLTQFPRELASERDRLVKTKGMIKAHHAMCDWEVAQFYERNERYAAAKYCYRDIAKNYPQTVVAEQAQTRLAELKDKPDSPPERFAFITDIFDGVDRAKEKQISDRVEQAQIARRQKQASDTSIVEKPDGQDSSPPR